MLRIELDFSTEHLHKSAGSGWKVEDPLDRSGYSSIPGKDNRMLQT